MVIALTNLRMLDHLMIIFNSSRKFKILINNMTKIGCSMETFRKCNSEINMKRMNSFLETERIQTINITTK
jgi:hypothetical protein